MASQAEFLILSKRLPYELSIGLNHMPTIHSIHYIMGEQEHTYQEALSFNKLIKERKIFNDPNIFGWGNYYSTESSPLDLGIATAKKTLMLSERPTDIIDTVLFCSTRFSPSDSGREILYSDLLNKLQIPRAFPIGLTLNGCTNLISAIDIAYALLSRDSCNNILIISADKIANEETRFSNYALFSDAAVSFVLSKENVNGGFKVVDIALCADLQSTDNNSPTNDEPLYKRCIDRIMSKNNFRLADVKKLFPSNIFSPITSTKEMRAGIKKNQLFLDNVPKLGHCFSADPIINLHSFSKINILTDKDYFLLSADSVGLRGLALLQYQSCNERRPPDFE
jgi:3-oxoacyl-[acyl-carrier-protein] synthase-3